MEEIKTSRPAGNGNGQKAVYISLKKQPDGFTFYGKYRSTYKGKNPENGNDKFTHYFETAPGQPETGINGTAQLDDLVSQITPGTLIAITKVGTAKSKSNRTVVQIQAWKLTPEEFAEKTGAPKLPF